MVEYQIVLNVFVPAQGGRVMKHAIRAKEREAAIVKYKYLAELVGDARRAKELQQWCNENLSVVGTVQSIDGLYGIATIKLM